MLRCAERYYVTLHRHVNVMEYIENNIAVLVTVYSINQESRHYKKDPMNIII